MSCPLETYVHALPSSFLSALVHISIDTDLNTFPANQTKERIWL